MTATITKIHPLKIGSKGVASYQRVEFKTDAGNWAKTDLVPSFRNYAGWKEYLEVGMRLTNLRMKSKYEVDADSVPKRLERPEQQSFL
jgi:hypothetical protein